MKLAYLKGVASIEFYADKCINCELCLNVCPHEVFAKNRENKIFLNDKDSCIECGACQKNCPTEAIKVAVGVGCASAIINAKIRGQKPTCGCSGNNNNSCC